MDSCNHTTTKVYVNGQLVAVTTLIYMDGTFQDFSDYRVTFLQAIAIPHDAGVLPASGYPECLSAGDGSANSVSEPTGACGEVQSIRMEIPPEPGTLAILAVGGLLAARRRRKR